MWIIKYWWKNITDNCHKQNYLLNYKALNVLVICLKEHINQKREKEADLTVLDQG